MDGERSKRKNLLSIDGGISGLPALYILDETLSRLQFDIKSDKELLPCEHFDMIMATGPGALVALLIGKLRLTTSKAIEAYAKLSSALPIERAKDDEERRENSSKFEQVFIEVLEDAGYDANSPMVDDKETKIVLCTSNTIDLSSLYSIQSYRTRGATPLPCTILQAARASIASPDTFLPVTIGSGHKEVVLVDALVGYANPTKDILQKAEEAFGEETEVSTIMSIGTGKTEIKLDGIDEGLKRGLALCEQVHEELQTRLGTTGIYYRFNVQRELGIEPRAIFGRVSSYLGERIIRKRLDEAIESIKSRPNGVLLKTTNSINLVEITLKPRPSLVSNFIGREDILGAMHRTHISNRSTELQTPTITVLSGIGGSGKTQAALKFALDFEKLYPEAQVFFLNASSEDSLKADLETLIRSQGPSHRTKSFEDALIYLANEVENWLMIFDNADDPSVRVFPFIPKCTSGNLVITTRNSNHAILSPNGHHQIEGLSIDEAIELILSLSRNEKTETNRAGGYIFVNKCLSQYLDLYHKNRAELLDLSELELPQDYQYTVATTIRMSMSKLPADAQDLMHLFAALDAASIAHEIIAKAANRRFRSVVETEEEDVDPRTLEHAEVLMKIVCPSGEWSQVNFGKIIRQCLQYSLLRLTTQGEAKFYSMHVLIQSYLQSYQQPLRGHQVEILTIRLLGAATTYGEMYEYMAFNRLLSPHLKRVDKTNIIEPGDHLGFGLAFYDVGDIKSSIAHRERCIEMWKNSLGEEHRSTLAAMSHLGFSYRDAGNSRKASEIEENLLEIYRRRFGPEHIGTLRVMSNLALSYEELGRFQEALDLNEEVLEVRMTKLGTNDPDTLHSMNNLATCYYGLGRHQESLEIWEKVVDIRRSTPGPEHPDTLIAISNLAASYVAVGRYHEALKLNEEALETRKRVLGSEHPSTLSSMSDLSGSYWDVGRNTESLELGQAALKSHIRILGPEHPWTLGAMRVQLTIFQGLGMITEMDELLQAARPLYEKVLGMDHPSTLSFNEEFRKYIDSAGGNPLPSVLSSPWPQPQPSNSTIPSQIEQTSAIYSTVPPSNNDTAPEGQDGEQVANVDVDLEAEGGSTRASEALEYATDDIHDHSVKNPDFIPYESLSSRQQSRHNNEAVVERDKPMTDVIPRARSTRGSKRNAVAFSEDEAGAPVKKKRGATKKANLPPNRATRARRMLDMAVVPDMVDQNDEQMHGVGRERGRRQGNRAQ